MPDDLLQLVTQMRAAQKRFYYTRFGEHCGVGHQLALNESIRLEQAVDAALRGDTMPATALRMTLNPPTEQEEQLAFFQRVMGLETKYPALRWVFHVGNGAFLGANRARYGRLLLNMGVRPGVPDICCPAPRKGYAGLWIEMKRLKYSPSDVKPEQRAYHDCLRAEGYMVAVCAGWIEAWNCLASYLGLEGESIE